MEQEQEQEQEFKCALTGIVMDNPVIAEDEYVYELADLEIYVDIYKCSPKTHKKVTVPCCYSLNRILKEDITILVPEAKYPPPFPDNILNSKYRFAPKSKGFFIFIKPDLTVKIYKTGQHHCLYGKGLVRFYQPDREPLFFTYDYEKQLYTETTKEKQVYKYILFLGDRDDKNIVKTMLDMELLCYTLTVRPESDLHREKLASLAKTTLNTFLTSFIKIHFGHLFL